MRGFAKRVVRAALNQFGVDLKRIPKPLPDPQSQYETQGRFPWSTGYREAKEQFIRTVTDAPELLSLFRESSHLPQGFGVGFDERCIEYPWLLANLAPGHERILDAGSALNHRFIVEHPLLSEKKLDILTLAPEDDCFWRNGVSYFFYDLRAMPLRDSHYSSIVCISTLEHVGFDNRVYTREKVTDDCRPSDFKIVMRELSRVLAKDGSLLLSVPFGKRQSFRGFQQFDLELLDSALRAFDGVSSIRQSFYRYGSTGWDLSSAEECADCEYVGWAGRVFSGEPWPQRVQREPDGAAAARAVACVKVTK